MTAIRLTAEEEELFSLLVACLQHFEKRTVLRVAGGWVRDKLLGKQSHDIDIALDDQSGLDFANLVNQYLLIKGLQARTIAVIQANPEQSKHLETANLRVLGFEIDCVNLRAETYADSRIPEMRLGTAQEDALRRDFTINSLFYHVQRREVEDLTGLGLGDLQQGLIRTPLSPFVTFQDDPLRLWRAVRFASRLGFALEVSVIQAAQSPDIQSALLNKVSRERVYRECEGMIVHRECRPCLGFLLAYGLGLWPSLFPLSLCLALPSSVLPPLVPAPASAPAAAPSSSSSTPSSFTPLPLSPTSCPPPPDWQERGAKGVCLLNVLLQMRRLNNPTLTVLSAAELSEPHLLPAGRAKGLYWASSLHSLAEIAVVEKRRDTPLYVVLLREGLKMESATIKSVQVLLEGGRRVRAMREEGEVGLEAAGSIVRQSRELWRDCIILATILDLLDINTAAAASGSGSENTVDYLIEHRELKFGDIHLSAEQLRVIQQYQQMESYIAHDLDLDNIWELKPLLDGAELMKRLSLPKGPLVGKVMEMQMQWQIRTRSNSKEECVEYLLSILDQLQ